MTCHIKSKCKQVPYDYLLSSVQYSVPVAWESGLVAFGFVLMRKLFEVNVPTKPSMSSTTITSCHMFRSSTSTLSSV